MTIITRPMVADTAQVQTRMIMTGVESTMSSKQEINSQLLDNFLKSCTGTTSIHRNPAELVPSYVFILEILTLPPKIIKKVLRNLLISPQPLILDSDFTARPPNFRTHVEPKVLQVCKAFYNIGIPILYGENTLTTSSPATSYDFDKHLLSLPERKRQMITDIRLEIDWADQLWAKFPLLARALLELRSLARLEIVIFERDEIVEERRSALIEEDANLKITLRCGQVSSGKAKPARLYEQAVDRTDTRMKRQGPVAEAMLKAEMKMLKDMVAGMKGLKHFRLIGFRHEAYAQCLEEQVRIGCH